MIRAYHFVGDTLRDGRPVPPDGVWLEHTGPIKWCRSGLYASRDPFDALQYAVGDTLCLVDCDGVGRTDSDKFVCRRRRIVKRFDAARLMREFAADCAEDVWHLLGPSEQLAAAWAIGCARRYARGETDIAELLAAAAAFGDLVCYSEHAAICATDPIPNWAAIGAADNGANAYSVALYGAARAAQRRHFNSLVSAEFRGIK